MKTLCVVLAMLVISAALLCLTQKAYAEQVMGKRTWNGQNEEKKRHFFVFMKIYGGPKSTPKHCGGVLIDTDTVLTAARCFQPYAGLSKVIVEVRDFTKKESLIKKMGSSFTKMGSSITNTNRKKRIEAVSVEIFEKMLKDKEKPGSDPPPDIARLKLAYPAVSKVEDAWHPCGPDFWNIDSLIDKKLTTVGMGKLSSKGKMTDVLQYLELQVTEERDNCTQPKDSNTRLYDNIDRFCAVGSRWSNKTKQFKTLGACDADDGGPIFNKDENGYASCLVGVVNQGITGIDKADTCGSGVLFTSIKNLETWLKNNQFTQIFVPEKKTKSSFVQFSQQVTNNRVTKVSRAA